MKYWEPQPRSRDYLVQHLMSDSSELVCQTLIEAAYHDPDWHWVQTECSRLSQHPDEDVRYVTVICLSHLARIHGQLDGTAAEAMMARLVDDPSESVTGAISDVRGDFEIYLGRERLT